MMKTLPTHNFMNASIFQESLGIGIDVDWVKTNPGREAMIKARSNGVNVPQLFKNRGFGHVRLRITDDVITDTSLMGEIIATVSECLACGLVPIIAYQAEGFKLDPTSDDQLGLVMRWWDAVDVACQVNFDNRYLAFNLVIETTGAVKQYNDRLNLLYEKICNNIRIRGNNRILIYAPNNISSAMELRNLEVPEPPGDCMAEWHFYAAGPTKAAGSKKQWTTGTVTEKSQITNAITIAKNWSTDHGYPTWVGAWMANNYNECPDSLETFEDGAPAGGDYSIDEQIVFATFMASNLKAAGIPFAVNSDTKYFDRDKNVWYQSTAPVLNAIFEA